VVNVVGRRTIFVRARCAPPRGWFTAVGILARHTRRSKYQALPTLSTRISPRKARSLSDVYGMPVSAAAVFARTRREAAPCCWFWGSELSGTAFRFDIGHTFRVCQLSTEPVAQPGPKLAFASAPTFAPSIAAAGWFYRGQGAPARWGYAQETHAQRSLTDLLRPRLPALRP
jgi:hypothetical protein